MTPRTSWTMHSGDRKILISAWVSPNDPAVVRFHCMTDNRDELLTTTLVVCRGIEDDQARVWRSSSALADDREWLDDWDDEDADLLAVLEVANWLTTDQVLTICRACAQEELDRANRNLETATIRNLHEQDRVERAVKSVHAAQLRDKALSFSTPLARSTAVAIAATFFGTPEDLEMLVATVS